MPNLLYRQWPVNTRELRGWDEPGNVTPARSLNEAQALCHAIRYANPKLHVHAMRPAGLQQLCRCIRCGVSQVITNIRFDRQTTLENSRDRSVSLHFPHSRMLLWIKHVEKGPPKIAVGTREKCFQTRATCSCSGDDIARIRPKRWTTRGCFIEDELSSCQLSSGHSLPPWNLTEDQTNFVSPERSTIVIEIYCRPARTCSSDLLRYVAFAPRSV